MRPTSPPDRPDVQLAVIIDIAVELLGVRGRGAASVFLEASGVSFAIICRVLTEPARRRRPRLGNVIPLPRLKRMGHA